MPNKYAVEDIRNLAFVGHGRPARRRWPTPCLFKAKAVDRRGSVDDGTSVSDYDDEEHKRQFSIDTSVLHLEYDGQVSAPARHPGYPDFVGAALGSAQRRRKRGHRRDRRARHRGQHAAHVPRGAASAAWRACSSSTSSTPTTSNSTELVTTIQHSFGKKCVLFNAPLGTGPAFSGVVSVLNPPAAAPAGCPVDLAAARSQLVDAVVESDETLMEKYLIEGDRRAAELDRRPAEGPRRRHRHADLLHRRQKRDIGIPELLDALTRYTPSPGRPKRMPTTAAATKRPMFQLEPDDGEFVGQVFKTLTDKFVGNLSFIRVFSRQAHRSSNRSSTSAPASRHASAACCWCRARQQKPVTEAIPGDIVAVAKVEDLHIGDTRRHLRQRARSCRRHASRRRCSAWPSSRRPAATSRRSPAACTRSPTRTRPSRSRRDAQTQEMVITGMSQLHLDVMQQPAQAALRPGSRHPRAEDSLPRDDHHQRRGRPPPQEADRRPRPVRRGAPARLSACRARSTAQEEFVEKFANKSRVREDPRRPTTIRSTTSRFIDHIVGGTIPNQFMPAVEKGCKELLERGALAGYRMQDVAVEVYFGKDHPVDSSEAAFKTAGRIAFKKAFLAARPVLLEPIVDLEVTVPSKYTGAILGDLNTKRARIENQDSLPGDLAVITGQGAAGGGDALRRPARQHHAGAGLVHDGVQPLRQVPGNVQQQIVSKAKVARRRGGMTAPRYAATRRGGASVFADEKQRCLRSWMRRSHRSCTLVGRIAKLELLTTFPSE